LETQLFDKMLMKFHESGHNTEKSWDLRADSFNHAQQKNTTDNSIHVTTALLEKGLLRDQKVLDIGGGTGRYALPFSEYAEEVTIADFSAQMLDIAKRNAENAGRRNLQYIKLNWTDADLQELGWEKKFDLVFASMCQGVRSATGLRKMSSASKRWCQINQFIERKDSLSQKIMKDLRIDPPRDVHNNRDITQALFNLLWLDGFNPEITYLKEKSQQDLSIDEAVDRYSLHFGRAAEEKGGNLKQLIEGYADGDKIRIESRVTLSLILWKV
jgi:SAM-dependent methyltransferase